MDSDHPDSPPDRPPDRQSDRIPDQIPDRIPDRAPDVRSRATFAAFLLAQVGAHAAKQFAERLAPLGLVPAHAGILRRLGNSSGISQRELATRLGMHASRLVGVVDEMESLGLVVREANTGDRRTYSLQLTPKGRETLQEIAKVSRQHNDALCAALNPEEKETLVALLQRIANQQGLAPGVHPGYSRLGDKPAASATKELTQAKEPQEKS